MSLKEAEKPLTAPLVIARLLEQHPEIIQISMASYSPHHHGTRPGDFYCQYIPVEDELSTFSAGQWRRTVLMSHEVVAIGSAVTLCAEKGCDHNSRNHWDNQTRLWYLWHEDCQTGPQGPEKSFIFLDIEMHQPGVLEKLGKVLEDIPDNWYVLDSGGGFHVILDRLVPLETLAVEYGEKITFFGQKLGKPELASWGEDLQKMGERPEGVFSWCAEVLQNCGHVDESLHETGRRVYIIDLRHIAHSLQKVTRYHQWITRNNYQTKFGYPSWYPEEIGGAFLRISPKNRGGQVPVLVAQRENQITQYFMSSGDPFNHQSELRLF